MVCLQPLTIFIKNTYFELLLEYHFVWLHFINSAQCAYLLKILKNGSLVLECTMNFSESFKMVAVCPTSHHFHPHSPPGAYQRSFLNAVRKDIKLISSNLPKGIWVRAYEDRLVCVITILSGLSIELRYLHSAGFIDLSEK